MASSITPVRKIHSRCSVNLDSIFPPPNNFCGSHQNWSTRQTEQQSLLQLDFSVFQRGREPFETFSPPLSIILLYIYSEALAHRLCLPCVLLLMQGLGQIHSQRRIIFEYPIQNIFSRKLREIRDTHQTAGPFSVCQEISVCADEAKGPVEYMGQVNKAVGWRALLAFLLPSEWKFSLVSCLRAKTEEERGLYIRKEEGALLPLACLGAFAAASY